MYLSVKSGDEVSSRFCSEQFHIGAGRADMNLVHQLNGPQTGVPDPTIRRDRCIESQSVRPKHEVRCFHFVQRFGELDNDFPNYYPDHYTDMVVMGRNVIHCFHILEPDASAQNNVSC